ncbi:MAG: transporter substrate-binding domain-containing protein, partial [Nocardioidaceae bacterium]|nr:transporter substrate-binding domain-containing protein [Nocardioidaceae bacterium]
MERFGVRRQRSRRGGPRSENGRRAVRSESESAAGRTGRRLGVAVALAAVLTGSGCAASTDVGPVLPAAVPRVPNPVGSVVPYSGPVPAPDCDVRQSLTPGTLPSPGRMPAGGTLAAIQERGWLTVGVDQATQYFAAPNPSTGALEGFDIAMAREVAKAIFGDPEKIRYRVVTPAQRMQVLKSGQVDLVVDTLSITCDRRKDADFTSPYYTDSQMLLVPVNSDAKRLEDLGGQKVCASVGSTLIQRILETDVTPKPIAYGVTDRADCLVAMQRGEVAAATTYQGLLAGLAAQDPQTKIVGTANTVEYQGFGVPKGHEDFVRFLNAHLERIKGNGTWQQIYATWIKGHVPEQGPPAAYYTGCRA